MAVRNYTSLYRLKDFLMNNIAPKYLADDEINISQIGLFGYITETLSVLGEDGLNATSIVFKECFASSAENVESLYLMAAIYQLDHFFATPATMPFIIIANEDDIISGGTANSGSTIFRIDGDTRFVIDEMPFMLEYDLRITSRKTANGYAHNVQYIMDKDVSMSGITNQYVRSKVIRYNNENYLAMLVSMRQMTFKDYTETIMANDAIHVAEFKYDMGTDDNGNPVKIAGFEAWYTAPGPTAKRTQLIKKLENTTKETEPFCFYTMPDEGVLKIMFSNDARYFVPEFNGELEVRIYTTTGADGNFSKYTGDNISIFTRGNKFEENNGLILFGQASGDSRGGKNSPTREEFRQEVITAQSTVQSYSTGNDLALFFKKMVNSGNTKIMFMKRRDDSLIRLFNAFTLLKDPYDRVIPTNTCDIYFEEEDIDEVYPESYRCMIKAGRLYRYSDIFPGSLQPDNSININDDLDKLEDDFVYALPFLIIMSSRPVNIGLYLNSVDEDLYLDSEDVNAASFVQFMVSGLHVYRNAVLGQDRYKLSLRLLPTSSEMATCISLVTEDTEITDADRTFVNPSDGQTYIDEKRMKVLLVFTDSGTETCYCELELAGFNDQYYTFEGELVTDDFVASNNKMRLIDSVRDINTGALLNEKFIPSSEIKANLYIFYKYEDGDEVEQIPNRFTGKVIDSNYTLTNKYSSDKERIDLIRPLNMIRAFLSYNPYQDQDGNMTYNYRVGSIPLIKANYVKDEERFHYFVDNFTDIYEYLNSEVDKLTNNFSIDIKFYNTYGKSKHYKVNINGEEQNLDSTNIRLKMAIKPYYTTDIENLLKDLKDYIINYLKSSFDNQGNNAYYNSNLFRSIENDFKDKIEYLVFKGINDYPLEIQKLESIVTEENLADHYDTMLDYVPEYINPYYKYDGTKWEPQVDIAVLS